MGMWWLKEPVFSINSTGLKDYDILARADRYGPDLLVGWEPLSEEFSDEFDQVFNSDRSRQL